MSYVYSYESACYSPRNSLIRKLMSKIIFEGALRQPFNHSNALTWRIWSWYVCAEETVLCDLTKNEQGNHLVGNQRSLIKLSFANMNDLLSVRRIIQPAAERNKKKQETTGVFEEIQQLGVYVKKFQNKFLTIKTGCLWLLIAKSPRLRQRTTRCLRISWSFANSISSTIFVWPLIAVRLLFEIVWKSC